jgi:hypothetical protein
MRFLIVLSVFAVSLLVACSGGEAPEQASSERETATRETVFDDLTGTLDRAEAVQDTIDASFDQRRRQLEEQER